MSEKYYDIDLERPLLEGCQEQQQEKEKECYDLVQKEQSNNNDDDSTTSPLCSLASLGSVCLGFFTQLIVFILLDLYMGHPPSIIVTLPVSIVISVTILLVVCSISQDFIDHVVDVVTSWTFVSGLSLGTVIQTISLSSTAMIAFTWGRNGIDRAAETEEKILYYVLVVLSQSWWVLFPIICLAIDGGLTGNGRSLFARIFFGNEIANRTDAATRRKVFLGGVQFHVGVVFGCFLVWSIIDVYFKASIAVLVTLAVSFVVCLFLCYGMVCIHDRYVSEEEARKEDPAETRKPLYVDGLLVV